MNLELENGRFVVVPLGRMVNVARFYDKQLGTWSLVEDPFCLSLIRKIYLDKFGVKLIGLDNNKNEIWDINYE